VNKKHKALMGTLLETVVISIILAAAILTMIQAMGYWSSVEQPVARSVENYGWLRVEEMILSGTGTDGAVSASQASDEPVRGHIYAVHLDFSSSITTTTDITLTQSSPSLTVLQLTDYYTDTWFYPATEYTNAAGTGLSAYDRLLASGTLTATVGETISGTIATVRVYWGE